MEEGFDIDELLKVLDNENNESIIKLDNRKNDNANMSLIEFVSFQDNISDDNSEIKADDTNKEIEPDK